MQVNTIDILFVICVIQGFTFDLLASGDCHNSSVLTNLLNQVDKVEVVIRSISWFTLIEYVDMVDSGV